MSGKPRRDVIFDRILERNPALGLIFPRNRKLKLSDVNDKYLFALSVINGLLKRISLRNSEEANVLEKSLLCLEKQFVVDLRLDDIEDTPKAFKNVELTLSKLSVPQLRRCLIVPDSLDLAEHAGRLLRTVPSKSDMDKRRNWVKKYHIHSANAAQSDGLLVEQVLAHKYGISESKVHKILAGASKFLR